MAVDVPLHGNLEFHKEEDIIKKKQNFDTFYEPNVNNSQRIKAMKRNQM